MTLNAAWLLAAVRLVRVFQNHLQDFLENGLKKDKRQFSELKKGLLMPEKIGHTAYS